MFADRKEHLKTIQKMLNDGYNVICDRYVGSTYIYQGDLGFGKIKELENWSECIKPDYEFMLYTTYEEYVNRKQKAKEVNSLDPKSELEFNHLINNMNMYLDSHKDVIPLDVTNIDEEELVNKILDLTSL